MGLLIFGKGKTGRQKDNEMILKGPVFSCCSTDNGTQKTGPLNKKNVVRKMKIRSRRF